MANKSQVRDITKTGPLNWRELQELNNGASESNSFAPNMRTVGMLQHALAPTRSLYDAELNMPQKMRSSLYNPEKENYWGNSHWDNDIANEEEFQHLSDVRAENQPWYSKAVNGIVKGGILAGTTFIDGTVGLLAGVGKGITNVADNNPNTGFIQGIWDNPITQTMNDITKWSEEALPNYYTEYQQDNVWSKENLFSANFVFDKVVKNMGFMLGAAFSGGIYAKGIGATARALGGAKAFAAAKRAGMTEKQIERAVRLGKYAADSSRASRATKSTIGAFFNAQAEATVEAVSNSDDFVENMSQQMDERLFSRLQAAEDKYNKNNGSNEAFIEYQQELAKIKQDREAGLLEIEKARAGMGTADFLFNIPILWAGDILTLGKFYAGGWKAARTEAKTATRATKEAIESAKEAAKAGDKTAFAKLEQVVKKAEQTGYQGLTAEERKLVEEVQRTYILPKWAGYTKATIANPLKEAHEEMAQAVASRAAGLYYQNNLDYIFDSQIDPNAQEHVMSWLNALWEGTKTQYGDINNYEEALIGGITGMLGSPTLGRRNNNTNQTWLGKGKLLGFSGGMVTEIRDYKNSREDAEKTAAHITKVLKDPNLENRLKHLVAQTKFADDKQQAIIHDDKMSYKDAETASIFEDVMYLKKGQRLDLLQNAVKQMSMEFSDEEIQEIVNSTSKQTSAYDARIQDQIKKRDTFTNTLNKLYQERDKLTQDLEQSSQDNSEQGLQNLENISKQLEQVHDQISQTEAELNTLNTYINNNAPVTLSPYIKADGTAMTADEIREDLKEKAQRIQTIIDDVLQVQDEIDESTGDSYTDEQLSTLTWYKVMMRDWDRRSNGILNEIRASIKMALDDQTIKDLLDSISNNAEVNIADSDGKPIYGGLAEKHISQWQKFQKSISDIISHIIDGVEDEKAGAALAMQLSDTTKVKIGDNETTYGDNLLEALKASIKSNPSFQNNNTEIEYLEKQLDDLKKIGESLRKYNELLEEFRKHPEKISKSHETTKRKNENKKSKNLAQAILGNFDWNAKIGYIAQTLQEQDAAIKTYGGLEKLLLEATPEQRKKLIAAQQFLLGVRGLKNNINNSDISEQVQGSINKLIKNHINESDSFMQLANSIRESSYEFDASNIPIENTEDITKVYELLDPANMSDIYKQASDKIRDLEVRLEKELQKKAKEISEMELNNEPSNEEVFKESEEVMPNEVLNEKNDDIDDIISEGEYDVVNEQFTKKEIEARNSNFANTNKASNKEFSGVSSYGSNRRQLTETLLSDPSVTLYDYYNAHKDKISKGVDKEKYLTYIKATSEFLKEEGAFDYIRNGNLHKGDVIEFGVDEELNKRAGTKVVLMYATNINNEKQIIGSIKSSFEFAQDRANGKTVESQEALYNAVVNGEKVTTKVLSLFGGMLPLTSTKIDNTLSDIFGNTKPVLAIATNNNLKSSSKRDIEIVVDPKKYKQGQVYVLIPTVTGKYLPALCVSKSLTELSEDGWYYKNILIPDILNALNKPTNDNIISAKKSFTNRLFMQPGVYIDGKFAKAEGDEVTHFRIGLKTNKNNKSSISFLKPIEKPKDGFTNNDAKDLIKQLISKAHAMKIDLTTRLDINRYKEDSEYASRILETLTTNLMTGEIGQHSINDGFLYELTDIEKNVLEKETTYSPIEPKGNTGIVGRSNVQTINVNGEDLEVHSNGAVTRNGKVVNDEEIAAQANEFARIDNGTHLIEPKEIEQKNISTFKKFGIVTKHGDERSNIRRSFKQGDSGRTFISSENIKESLSTVNQIKHSMEEVRRMFPALNKQGRIILIDGILHTTDVNGNPVKAFGLFKNGILYISSNSPLGTAYHEAFHYMTAFIMNDKQRNEMFEIAREQFGNIEELALEEKLAEKFREYVNGYEDKSLVGRIKNFFRTLKNLLDSIRGRELYLDTLFFNIYKGNWAILDTEDNYHQKLIEYREKSLSYNNLAQEDRDYLNARHVSKEDFDRMTVEQKELFLHCM